MFLLLHITSTFHFMDNNGNLRFCNAKNINHLKEVQGKCLYVFKNDWNLIRLLFANYIKYVRAKFFINNMFTVKIIMLISMCG